MNKMLLGVLALSSVTGLATSLHGYVDSKSEVSADKTVTYKEGKIESLLDPTSAKLKTRLDLGVFLNERKDMFAFAGTELGRDKTAIAEKEFYVGGRVDTEIGHGFNLVVNVAHKSDFDMNDENKAKGRENYFKNALVKHLEAKSKWNKDASDDDKKVTLKSAGYLDEKNYSTLLSAVVDGKVNETSLELGSIYRTLNFESGNNNLTSFINVKHDFSVVKTETGLEHVLDSSDAPKYYNYGTLTGYVNLSSDKVKDTTLSSKNSFNLKSGAGDVSAPGTTSRMYELETKNEVVYKGVKDLEVVAKANYKFADDKVYGKTAHTPEFGLKLVYTGVKGLTLTTDNINKVEVKRTYGVKATETSSLTNRFETKNSAEYKVNDVLTTRGKVNYLLNSTNLNQDAKVHTHSVLAGLGLTAKGEISGVTYESNLDATYRLRKYVKDDIYYTHSLFAYSTNKLGYKFNNNLKLDVNLNASNFTDFNYFDPYFELGKEVPGKFAFSHNRFVGNLGAKLTYNKNKLEATTDLQLYYSNVKELYELLDNKVFVSFDNNLTYNAMSNVKLMAGLKAEYTYNKFNMEDKKEFEKFVKEAGYKDGEYKIYDEFKKDIKDVLDSENVLNLTPKVSAEFKFVDGRLTVKPALEAGFKFFDGEADNDTAKKVEGEDEAKNLETFRFKNVSGKATLDINYAW